MMSESNQVPNDFDPVAYINEPRWQQSRLGLERITELLDRMGRPQDKLKFVHVAGTNGKGSTCSFIAQTLQEAGYRTGLFTSPYIIAFEERIRVDGANIPSDDLRSVTSFVRGHAEAMAAVSGEHPTEFELMTAVAFEHFARSACDIVVCEVGLGGRLDSTNIIEDPEACVICRIGLDHTEFLGDTQAAVAAEKAGIIKRGALVVSWPQDDEGATEAIAAAAARCGADVVVPDMSELVVGGVTPEGVREFTYRGRAYTTHLLGSYQPSNAALAIEALVLLRRKGWKLSDETIARGIAATVWPGRFEVVKSGGGWPAIVVDGGHNPQGAEVLAESLLDVFPGKRIAFVMSVLADKDYPAMIGSVLPLADSFSCVTPPSPRALSAADLAREIGEIAAMSGVDAPAVPFESFAEALEHARDRVGEDGVVCAFGSLYSISEIERALAALS